MIRIDKTSLITIKLFTWLTDSYLFWSINTILVAPFNFEKVDPLAPCVFALKYGKLDDYLPLMCQLQRAATLPPVEQNGMIAAIVYSTQNRTDFDNCWLESVQEKILTKVNTTYDIVCHL